MPLKGLWEISPDRTAQLQAAGFFDFVRVLTIWDNKTTGVIYFIFTPLLEPTGPKMT
ncbi:hypothetical protein HC931_01320 [Candidatus Gracilibacteria bacterium]|nr:hypothetical protein [Candidatus Gracilibacteria bacterium]